MTLSEHLNKIRNRPQPDGYKIDMCFGDAAEPGLAEEVTQNYVYCAVDPEAKKSWQEGVELVKRFLKEYDTGLVADEYGTPITKPKLFVDHSCETLIREFNNYKAPEAPRNSRNKQSPREAAQKYRDDGLDALRYALVHIYKLGANHHLNEVMDTGSVLSRPTFASSELRAGDLAAAGSSSGPLFSSSNMQF
jgi:hypothetical protein